MKVFITKFALTKGIFEIEAERCMSVSPDMIKDVAKVSSRYWYHGEGNEWHSTMESAIKKAKEMRKAKIISLQKQIDKLDKLKFK